MANGIYKESTRKGLKYDPPIQGASLCSRLKNAIFDHFSMIFANCANIFDKKTAKIAILIHKEGLHMIWS